LGDHLDHAEVVEIVFVPRPISRRDILEFFFQIHDRGRRTVTRAVMNDQEIVFTKEMEGIDTVSAHLTQSEPVSV
jgi:peptide methionine sulfoxide reductase MsrA